MPLPKTWDYNEIVQFHDRVRALLNNISNASLPDEYIDMPEKAPYAEMYAKSRVRNWQELDEIQTAMFESAIVYKTASFFENLVSSNSVKKEELPTITLEYFAYSQIQFDGLSLNQIAESLLSGLIDTSTNVIGFMVT